MDFKFQIISKRMEEVSQFVTPSGEECVENRGYEFITQTLLACA
jgi:hypothetical protein